MKNKKLATLVAIPLALSFSFGISACTAPMNPNNTTVAQEQATEAAAFKANAVSTMESVKKVLAEPETVNTLAKLMAGEEDSKNLDVDDKIWKQIEPFAGFATDDESLRKLVFGNNPMKDETAKMAKLIILSTFAYSIYDVSNEFEQPKQDFEKLAKYSYEFTSTKNLPNGNIIPQNQAFIVKNDEGSIVDVKYWLDEVGFTKDGKKFIYDPARFSENKAAGIDESVQTDATSVARVVETFYVLKEAGGTGVKISKSDIEKHIKENMNFSEGNVMDFEYNPKDFNYKITVTNGDQKSVYDSANGGIVGKVWEESTENDTPVNLLFETFSSVQAFEPKTMDALEKGGDSYMKLMENHDEPNAVTEIITKGELSEDKKKIKTIIDGNDYWFMVPTDVSLVLRTDKERTVELVQSEVVHIAKEIVEFEIYTKKGEVINRAEAEGVIKKLNLSEGSTVKLEGYDKNGNFGDKGYKITVTNNGETAIFDQVMGGLQKNDS